MREGIIYSDSKEKVLAMAYQFPVIADWRSYEDIRKAWIIQRQQQNRISVVHCRRDHPNLSIGIGIAHRLAKQERLYG